jgi:hypothetical protein
MKRVIVMTVVLLFLVLSIVSSQGGRMWQSLRPGQTMFPMMQGQGMTGQGMTVSSLHDELADLLGVTREELFALRKDGRTFAEVIEGLGGKLETITSQLAQSRNDTINETLANKTLTQAQAEPMKTRSSMIVTAMLNKNVGFSFSTPMNKMGTTPCPQHGQMMFNR